jgi:hypothetical protein
MAFFAIAVVFLQHIAEKALRRRDWRPVSAPLNAAKNPIGITPWAQRHPFWLN